MSVTAGKKVKNQKELYGQMPPKIIKALETIELGAYGNDMSILQGNKTIEATLGNNKKICDPHLYEND